MFEIDARGFVEGQDELMRNEDMRTCGQGIILSCSDNQFVQ
jgi:hypothetical protein